MPIRHFFIFCKYQKPFIKLFFQFNIDMDEEQLKALIRNKVREESFKELNDMQANHKEGKCIYKET